MTTQSESGMVRVDGRLWPCPSLRWNFLDWALRDGKPTKDDLYYAADVLEAYRCLVEGPVKQRATVLGRLRRIVRG